MITVKMYYFNLAYDNIDELRDFVYGYVQMENGQNCGFFCMNYEHIFEKYLYI